MTKKESKTEQILVKDIHNQQKRDIANWSAKDSVFRDLFSDERYVLELYQSLHPEDKDVKKEDIEIITMQNILLNQTYNDLGFMVGDQLIILVEAQSTWTMNIIVRSLMYLVQTWMEYIALSKQSIYGSSKISLPKAELYVIYTGKKKKCPQKIYLSQEFFEGRFDAVEVKVNVINKGRQGDIINQYIQFTQILNAQIKDKGRTKEAVEETIRICQKTNILKEYLEERKREVARIMADIFSEEYQLRLFIEAERHEAAKEAKARAEKAEAQVEKAEAQVEKAEARAEKVKADIIKLLKEGHTIEEVEQMIQ